MNVQSNTKFSYHIDAADRITGVNEAWLSFARENDAAHLTESAIVGRVIWDFIDGTYTRHLYEILFEKVRDERQAVTVPFNCDSPTLIRSMQLTAEATPEDGIAFTGELLFTEVTPYVPLHDRRMKRDARMIQMCSFCKAVFIDGNGWVTPQEAIRRLNLFAATEAPIVSHGVCGNCMQEFTRRLRGTS